MEGRAVHSPEEWTCSSRPHLKLKHPCFLFLIFHYFFKIFLSQDTSFETGKKEVGDYNEK